MSEESAARAEREPDPGAVLVIACGALAREINYLKTIYGWEHLHMRCIDAKLHNRPERIPYELREEINRNRGNYAKIFVAYADCGTGGAIDKVIRDEGIERLPGAHCYQFFAGMDRFAKLADAEPGTFYLTDFLARHFNSLVVAALKLDEHPELRDEYFGNYRKLVYLSQLPDMDLLRAAEDAARYLGLDFEHIETGFGELESSLKEHIAG